jgi:alpha-L-rhamnosidase
MKLRTLLYNRATTGFALLLVILMGLPMHSCVRKDGSPAFLKLTVNLRETPLGIDSHPNFSWNSCVNKQTAYKILVAESLKGLENGEYVWDTGVVNSSRDFQVSYEGPTMKPATRYYWRVHTWDEEGNELVSSPSWWETGLLNGNDWEPAQWIGGREPQDHDWTDMTATVTFRITDVREGITFLFHAEPIGKTWGESYNWKICAAEGTGKQAKGAIQLELSTQHYVGNTGVPEPDEGEEPVRWGVNYLDPQAETNPIEFGIREVPIATISANTLGGISWDNLTTQDHELKVKAEGNTITTWINGTEVDKRTLSGDRLRKNGSIGFTSGSHAIVRSVKVEAADNPTGNGSKKDFFSDFHGGFNPFEDGNVIWTGVDGDDSTDGLLLTSGVGIMLPIANPAPLLRKEFLALKSPVKSARLYITGGGYPKVAVNGIPITIDGELPDDDGFTIPRLTPDDGQSECFILYNTFDVTRFIRSGKINVLSVELGRGWTGLTTPNEWYWNMIPAHGSPRTKAKLVITYKNGTREEIVSDGTWKTIDGPTLFDSVYSGEKYDAGKAKKIGDWRSVAYDDGEWNNVTVMNPMGSYYGTGKHSGPVPPTGPLPDGFIESKLKAMENEPIVVREVLKPVEILETYPGSKVYLFKFEQMHSGWPKLHLKNVTPDKAGLAIRIRGDNIIHGNGTKDDPYYLSDSKLFVASILQADYYILSDDAEQVWTPSFHYNGQGGIEVYGLYNVLGRAPNMEQDADLITAEVASSGFPANSVSTSNDLLNRIHSLCEWTILNNAHGHPTDTPSREKNGWTGDGWADSETWMLNFDVSQFYRLWVRDMAASMNRHGEINVVVPGPRAYGYENTPGWIAANGPVPAWDHAFFEIPLELYRYYGDLAILKEIYPNQDKLMKYYSRFFTKANRYTYTNIYLCEYATGTLGSGSIPNINHQLYFRMASCMAKFSSLLGLEDKEREYQALADDVLKEFIDIYWDEKTGSFQKGERGNLQTEQLLAVAYNMVPGNDLPADHPAYLRQTSNTRQQNIESCMAVVANSLTRYNKRIGVGIYGLRYLFTLLNEHGYKNLAYSIATGLESPSWGNILLQGGTTLQELWGGIHGNHHYHSSILTWYYQGLAGITPASPGYEAIQFKPFVPTNKGNSDLDGTQANLTSVTASINTARGLVESTWDHGDNFTLTVTVPGNTLAEVWVPAPSGELLSVPEGAEYLRKEGEYVVYSVGQGTWTFVTSKLE